MKRFWNTFLLFMFCGIAAIAQPIILTDTVIQTSICAGSNIIVPFTVVDTGGSFNFGNIFTAQLSDQFTGFSNPTEIGSFPIPWTTSGFILGTIPVSSPLAGIYKVRVVGSNPATIGSECPNFVVIINTATLAIINAPDSAMCAGDSITLTATPFFTSHQWALDGNNISGATNSTFVAYLGGNYTVTVVDTIACESTSEPFEVHVAICSGMEEAISRELVNMYPNPCADILNISYDGSATASVKNLLGQRIVSARNFEGDLSLSLSGLDAGLYFAEIQVNGKRLTRKFVKK
ncbi:MAG TPA: T9SS type A sorting domain-containing protein [Flavobacteriales bacterium]|nr:T9SS type A sorting domain-containing protein [Flavobacteriales bacterium]